MTTPEVHSGQTSKPGVQRFHRRPVPVEAIRWIDGNCKEVYAFLGMDHSEWDEDDDHEGIIWPFPLSGRLYLGDWVLKDEAGGFSVLIDLYFRRDYQPIEAGEE